MYNVIKKNQKKLMAAFAVLLMISFVATIGGRPGGSGRGDVVVGHLGKTAVYDSELRQAKEEWSWLSRHGNQLPLPTLLIYHEVLSVDPTARDFNAQMGAFQVAHTITDNIEKHPEMFLLLQKEAAANGLTVSTDEANEFLKNAMGIDVTSPEHDAFETKAIQDMLTVRAELRYLTSAMKISQPVWEHQAAQEQSVRLNIVDFRADDFEKAVPAPTTQQVDEQFDKYKDIARNDANPLAFGYQIPTRVKLQYVEVPRSQVIDSVIRHVAPPATVGAPVGDTSDAQYEWEVQAALYYDAHKEDYRNTPPATTQSASTQSATTQAVVTSQPAFKPFDEVKREIIQKLAATQIDDQAKKIAADVASQLAADFTEISKTSPASIVPTTQSDELTATARPAADAMMLAHLELIRATIDEKYHVAIELHDIASDWQTTAALGKLPGIGSASTADGISFTDYATNFASPSSPGSTSLKVWEPSQPLTDTDKNAYVFRLTAAKAAHAPPSVAAVLPQVVQDWRLAQAYDQAKEAAEKTFASAKAVGLSQAARTAGQTVTATPLFPPQHAQDIPGYRLPNPGAAQELLAAASDLVSQATPSDKHPDKLVELPAALRAVILELAAVQLDAPQWQAQLSVSGSQRLSRLQKLASDWFTYDNVLSRTGYKPEEKS